MKTIEDFSITEIDLINQIKINMKGIFLNSYPISESTMYHHVCFGVAIGKGCSQPLADDIADFIVAKGW